MKILAPITESKDVASRQFVLDNAGGSPIASNVSFTPPENFPTSPNNPGNTVQKAIENLFTSANSGKQDVADSIGYTGTYSGTFQTLAGNIDTTKAKLQSFLPQAEQTLTGSEKVNELADKLGSVRVFKQQLNLKKVSGATTSIQLTSPYPSADKVMVTPCVRVDDAATTELVAAFNNGDGNDFITNDYITFDGVAKLKNNYSYAGSSLGGGITEYTVNASQFEEFKELSYSGGNLQLVARPKPQVLIASGNIPLDSVDDIFKVTRTVGGDNYSSQYWVVSFDSGTRWYGNVSSTVGGWEQVDITDVNDFDTKATWRADIQLDAISELRALAGNNPNTVKFAYLLRDNSYTQKNTVDKLELQVVVGGTFVPYGNAGGSYVTSAPFSYNQTTGVVTVNHPVTDAYIINYLDKATVT